MFIFQVIKTFIEQRKAISSLREMDDRMLRDIGLQRDSISDAVRTGQPAGSR